jgi:hypothetical protein
MKHFEREREQEFDFEKEAIFPELGHAFRGKRYNIYCGSYCMDYAGRTTLNMAHKSR